MTIARQPSHLNLVMLPISLIWSFVGALVVAGGFSRELGPFGALLLVPVFAAFVALDVITARAIAKADAKREEKTKSIT